MDHCLSQLLRRLSLAALAICAALALAGFAPPSAPAQAAGVQAEATALQGIVADSSGGPVADATIHLVTADGRLARQVTSNAAGVFVFPALPPGSYHVSAEKGSWQSPISTVRIPAAGRMRLLLDAAGSAAGKTGSAVSAPTMQFSDQPSFTISGVTDWTAVGGHGSDSILRTSESLARDTVSLPSQQPSASTSRSSDSEHQLLAALAHSPGDFAANHQLGAFYLHAGRSREAIPLLESAWRLDPANAANVYDLSLACEAVGDLAKARQHIRDFLSRHESADLHRLAGELDEKSNDPLDAVREFERAVHEDPSEQNYFEWGSELLLHRAVWQALEVLQKGTAAWPHSARMRTARGAALFAGARYDDAALRLCEASDLDPSDPQPYIFMGKVELASPQPLPCIAARLQRFLAQQPQSSLAHYLNAMAILKQQQDSPDAQAQGKAEALLRQSVALDPRNADAWLQLGIRAAARGQFAQGIPLYQKAIAADPQLVEAHYRLAVAYDRTGLTAQAREEFQLHDQLEKQQADAIERQRKEIKQFLITQPARADVAPSGL